MGNIVAGEGASASSATDQVLVRQLTFIVIVRVNVPDSVIQSFRRDKYGGPSPGQGARSA